MLNMNFLRKYWGRSNQYRHKYPEISDETFLGFPGGPVVCFICKADIPQMPRDQTEAYKKRHKNSEQHLENQEAVKRNGILFDWPSRNWKLLCRVCNKSLGFYEKVLFHITSFDHKAWFVEMEKLIVNKSLLLNMKIISIEDFLRSESDFAYCNVCDLDIECTLKGVATHESTESHRKQLLEALKPCTGLFPIENDKVMWCKVCDLRLENNFEEILQHLTCHAEHGSWFSKVDIMCHEDISITDFLTDEKEMKVKCCRCDIKIKCDPKSIKAHVHSETHRHRYKNASELTVKSLADQDIWPSWCNWKMFGQPA